MRESGPFLCAYARFRENTVRFTRLYTYTCTCSEQLTDGDEGELVWSEMSDHLTSCLLVVSSCRAPLHLPLIGGERGGGGEKWTTVNVHVPIIHCMACGTCLHMHVHVQSYMYIHKKCWGYIDKPVIPGQHYHIHMYMYVHVYVHVCTCTLYVANAHTNSSNIIHVRPIILKTKVMLLTYAKYVHVHVCTYLHTYTILTKASLHFIEECFILSDKSSKTFSSFSEFFNNTKSPIMYMYI